MYARPIQNLIDAFKKLPSVGPRTAERFVFHLLKSGKKDVGELSLALKELVETIKSCQVCWDFSDKSPCAICSDPRRNRALLCVVSESQEVQSIEKLHIYNGLYHVLRGTITPEDPQGIENTKVPELFQKIRANDIQEVILALNPNMAGETTMMYLEREIKQQISPAIKVSRLARGLPIGADLEYADEMTLESAFKNRISN